MHILAIIAAIAGAVALGVKLGADWMEREMNRFFDGIHFDDLRFDDRSDDLLG